MDLLQRLFLTYKLDSKIFKLSEVISDRILGVSGLETCSRSLF